MAFSMAKLGSLSFALVGFSACGTMADLGGNHDFAFDSPGPHVYGGVRLDAIAGTRPFGTRGESPCGIFHWLDIPVSAAFDTMLLPVTVVLSFSPEGREFVTINRGELDRMIDQEQSLPYGTSLRYLGSADGYHHLQFSRLNRAVTHYRISDRELLIEMPFAYTGEYQTFVVIKNRDDPWPLPEPLKKKSP